DGYPRDAVVVGLPHAAAGGTHVEDAGLRTDTGRRRRAPAAMRTDRTPAQVLIRVRVDDDVRVRLRARARGRAVMPEGDERHRRRAREQCKPFHDDPLWLVARSYHRALGGRLAPRPDRRRARLSAE